MARICIEYEADGQESPRRPVSLLDALQSTDRGAEDKTEQVDHLSTLSLQYDKRMDDKLRGGKRKIILVQGQKMADSEDVSGEDKPNRAKKFLAEMKTSLSQVSFDRIIQTLQSYKRTDDLDQLLTETALLAEDTNTHGLLRGFYQFVRPHHKQRFDERCRVLTGQGCGFRPDHALSKEDRKELHSATNGKVGGVLQVEVSSSDTSTCSELNTQQLNKGGAHLSHDGLRAPPPVKTNDIHASFLADVKKALGAEKSSELFQAVRRYKTTENYEDLIPTVVSLFTEKDEDFRLLVRFGMFLRSQHKKQYKEMLAALSGESIPPTDVSNANTDQPQQASSSPLKTQSKISSFFSSK